MELASFCSNANCGMVRRVLVFQVLICEIFVVRLVEADRELLASLELPAAKVADHPLSVSSSMQLPLSKKWYLPEHSELFVQWHTMVDSDHASDDRAVSGEQCEGSKQCLRRETPASGRNITTKWHRDEEMRIINIFLRFLFLRSRLVDWVFSNRRWKDCKPAQRAYQRELEEARHRIRAQN